MLNSDLFHVTQGNNRVSSEAFRRCIKHWQDIALGALVRHINKLKFMLGSSDDWNQVSADVNVVWNSTKALLAQRSIAPHAGILSLMIHMGCYMDAYGQSQESDYHWWTCIRYESLPGTWAWCVSFYSLNCFTFFQHHFHRQKQILQYLHYMLTLFPFWFPKCGNCEHECKTDVNLFLFLRCFRRLQYRPYPSYR